MLGARHNDRSARRTLVDLLLLFLFAAALIKPLFFAGYLNVWGSIENTFIADARFLVLHWPHPRWQPLWYTGTRFDYVYPPAIRYGSAIFSMLLGIAPVQAYHTYTAFFYCVGIAGVYWLVWVGRRSRGSAWLAALASALVSPSFLLLSVYRHDSPRHAPQRLHVLIGYGEGPHMTAFALLPIALAFTWLAMERRRPVFVVLAAVFSAAVVSNNFYGATALALFYLILAFSFWITRGFRGVAAAAIAIPLLAYGLTSFWLVPSYVRVTSENMRHVAIPGNSWSLAVTGIVAAVFAVSAWVLARNRPERTWPVFVAGSVIFFTLNVAGNYFFGFRVTGEPHRWVPELDLVLTLGAVAILGVLWNLPFANVGRSTAILLAGAAFFSAMPYVRHAWEQFPPWPDYRTRVEYRISEWMSRNMPDSRIKAGGSVRLWLDVWHDLAELGGGSDQGALNDLTLGASYEIDNVPKSETSILWMQCLGVDAVYVSEPRSEEVYKELRYPQKFTDVLPVSFDDGQGNLIYKVPRRYPARARVVETAAFNALSTPQSILDLNRIRAYADAIERGPDSPVSLTRETTDAMRLRARLDPGQSILVQESYDPAWRAWSGSGPDRTPLAIHKDIVGFMAIDAPPGDREIFLEFAMPLENRIGWIVTALTVVLLLVFLIFGV